MPADRFYLNAPLNEHETISLEGTEHHHLSHVMKLKIGENVELINGNGTLAEGQITQINKKNSSIKITHCQTIPPPSTRFILAVPLMRPSKLEWVIEKGTELGADLFLIYRAIYSEKETLSEHQTERLHNLSIAACKQSGRLYVPRLEVVEGLEALFKRKAHFLFGDTRLPPSAEIPQTDSICFISGPERGFSEKELRLLDEKATGMKLNSNILRAETAPIAAMSILGQRRK